MASASPTVERNAGQTTNRSGDGFEPFFGGTKTPSEPWSDWTWRRAVYRRGGHPRATGHGRPT